MEDVAGRRARSEHGAPRLLGDFRLERLIARGGMAIVYEARQTSEDRRVALKLMDPAAAAEDAYRERFKREARAAMSLEHPNVVPVYGAGEAEGSLFIAMRLIEGQSLKSIIELEGPLPFERVLGVVEQIAAALDAAHASGLVHRDVKPSNVMVEQLTECREHCYVLDFGLAVDRNASAAAGADAWTGTPAYVSPEQLRGEPVDGRTDVYALGVLAFHALTGRTPYAREHDPGTLLAHLHAPPPSLSELRRELPRAVDRVIARALAKDPEARHGSAGELAADLALVFADGPPPPAAGPSPTATRASASRGNLPTGRSALIGRWVELETLREELAGSRLLSIVGPGGVGKTALALHLSASVEPEYAGAWVLELDPVQDAAGLELALARTLGLRIASLGSIREALIELIGQRRLLFIFDNCDHLVAPVGGFIGELLSACPRLTVIATSRERLATEDERVHALGPLEVPDVDDEPEDVLASDSARLLLQRAAEQGVPVAGAGAPAIAAICARLAGIPLALELAAAQLRTLSADGLARRLQQDLSVLAPAGAAASARLRTLDELIDSSWRLLDAQEQRVLARLATFSGAFTLDAAEAVAGRGEGRQIPPGRLVLRLAEKSLLQVGADRAQTRFRMLQPVREFCLARLPAPQRASARAAHRGHYLGLAEHARPMFDCARSAEWIAKLDDDQVNIRAAIESGLEDGDPESALRIGVATCQYWVCRGLAGEGIELLVTILRRAGLESPTALRAEAHSAVAHLAAVGLGDIPTTRRHALEALRLARSSGDAHTAAQALTSLSWSDTFAGRAAEGLAHAQEALSGARAIESPTLVGRLIDAQAIALEHLGQTGAARLAYEQARDVFAHAGYGPGVASAENHLGDLELSCGDLAAAASHFSLARRAAEDAGDGASVAMATLNLALIDQLEGRRESARELFLDCLMTNHACGDRPNLAFSIFGLALTEHEPARAAELHGSASRRLAQLDIALSPLEERLQGEELARLRAGLGAERFDRLIEQGHELPVEDLISALEDGGEAVYR